MKTLKILGIAVLLSPLTLLFVDATSAQDKTLDQIAGYKLWTRINAQPIHVTVPQVEVSATPLQIGEAPLNIAS